jgi:hypothetical protein
MTKLSIPHEFVQRTVLPNKRATPTPTPTPKGEGLHDFDSTGSLDSAAQTSIGLF